MNIFGNIVDPWVFWTFILVLICTLITVWRFARDCWANRMRLIIKTTKLVSKDEIMATIINKTGEQIKFRYIGIRCKSKSGFDVPSELRTFDGTDYGVDDEGRPVVIMENNARYVFWLNIKDIKKRYFAADNDALNIFGCHLGSMETVTIMDYHGRLHKGRIPGSIKKLLNK